MRRGLPKRAYRAATHPVNQVKDVALALYLNGDHIGLLHRDPSQPGVLIAHHCRHDVLLNVPVNPAKVVLWIVPNLDADEREQVAARCRRVGRAPIQRAFPYANSDPRAFFNSNLDFAYGAGRLGLTCASFVLAVFNSCGIDIVDFDSWQVRIGDKEFQEHFMRSMAMPDAHKAAIRNDGVMPRYRPLEVAGAAATGRRSVRFGRAVKYAKRLEPHVR
jgi:hypothetical protein